METVEVRTWGPAFSLLLFETAKVTFHQDGFLLGTVIHRETTKVTDADHEVLHKECIVNVESMIPCSTQFYFYDAAGVVDFNKIKQVLGDRTGEVVGWYVHKQKHATSSSKLTLREKIIHKYLVREFDNPNFVCCVSSSTLTSNVSTHSFTQLFLRYSKGEFKNLQFHINNLTDPNSEFKYDDPVSNAFKSIIKTSGSGGRGSKQPLNIRNVQKQVETHTKKLISEVSNKEKDLQKLEAEIHNILKQKRKRKELIASSELNAPDSDNASCINTMETPPLTEESSSVTPQKKQNSPPNVLINIVDAVNANITDSPNVVHMTRSKRTYSSIVQSTNK